VVVVADQTYSCLAVLEALALASPNLLQEVAEVVGPTYPRWTVLEAAAMVWPYPHQEAVVVADQTYPCLAVLALASTNLLQEVAEVEAPTCPRLMVLVEAVLVLIH
jgi:hypothetical protein